MWLVKLLPTCHLPSLRNAMTAPIALQPGLFVFHSSLFRFCKVPTCPTPLSVAHRDCTTLCDFLHSLLYRPCCWRLTIRMNFVRSPWPSCLQSQGKEMHHPVCLSDLLYLHLSGFMLNLSLNWQETNSNTTSKEMINPFCRNYHLWSAGK